MGCRPVAVIIMRVHKYEVRIYESLFYTFAVFGYVLNENPVPCSVPNFSALLT